MFVYRKEASAKAFVKCAVNSWLWSSILGFCVCWAINMFVVLPGLRSRKLQVSLRGHWEGPRCQGQPQSADPPRAGQSLPLTLRTVKHHVDCYNGCISDAVSSSLQTHIAYSAKRIGVWQAVQPVMLPVVCWFPAVWLNKVKRVHAGGQVCLEQF